MQSLSYGLVLLGSVFSIVPHGTWESGVHKRTASRLLGAFSGRRQKTLGLGESKIDPRYLNDDSEDSAEEPFGCGLCIAGGCDDAHAFADLISGPVESGFHPAGGASENFGYLGI